MSTKPELSQAPREPRWVRELAADRPDMVLMAPYMLYLLALALQELVPDVVPQAYVAWLIALRGFVGFYAFWLFRRHLPPLGKPNVMLGIICGVVAAALWVGGHKLFQAAGLGFNLFSLAKFDLTYPEVTDPSAGLSSLAWWSQAVFRIGVASTTVAIVEELFWRAFLLRAFINWNEFDRIPLGTFAWKSFLITSLLSTLQHPAHWGVSIFCWFLFNALFIWKRSLLFLMIVHGMTNLALYIYVIVYGEWVFW